MELKEYLNIIKKNQNLFFGITIAIVLIALGYFYLLPVRYDASLTINITRAGSQETADYKYDDYYRLQADQSFADTLVEWLKSPRLVSDIYSEAGLDAGAMNLGQLSKSLSSERKSAQTVAVSFSAPTAATAQKISYGITKVISDNTAALNENQKETNWFEIMAATPVVVKYQPDYKIIFVASLLLGIFLGFWGVMAKHYLE